MHSVTHRGFGNMLGWLHDQATRSRQPIIHDPKKRRCEFGKHIAANKGGKFVGRVWCCKKCLEVVK